MRTILAFLELRDDERIIDIGCGDAIITLEVAKSSQGTSTIIGLDLSKTRIKRAKIIAKNCNLDKKTLWVVGDACFLPFRQNAVDKIVMHHVLEHVPNDNAAIKELVSVVKPNGSIIIGIPNEDTFAHRIADCYLRRNKGWHINKYSLGSIITKLGIHHLKIIRLRGVGLVIPILPIHYAVLGSRVLFSVADALGRHHLKLADSFVIKAVCDG